MHAKAAVFIVIAIPFVLLALLAFLFGAIAAWRSPCPCWASALIVGGVLLLVALIFGLLGLRSVRKAGIADARGGDRGGQGHGRGREGGTHRVRARLNASVPRRRRRGNGWSER